MCILKTKIWDELFQLDNSIHTNLIFDIEYVQDIRGSQGTAGYQ